MMRITLPIYMLAIRLQNTWGCSEMNSGPGRTPWIRRAIIITAVAGPVGIPSCQKRDHGALPEAALLAVSGPATPSMRPVPNSSGLLASRFSAM